jgi:hypothetical protein
MLHSLTGLQLPGTLALAEMDGNGTVRKMNETLRFDGGRFVQETVEDAVLVIDVAAGRCFALDGAATALWPSLLAGVEREALLRAAEAAFAAPAHEVRSAVDGFLAELLEEKVVLAVAGRANPPRVAPGTFEPPRVKRYDDLQDLLKPEDG